MLQVDKHKYLTYYIGNFLWPCNGYTLFQKFCPGSLHHPTYVFGYRSTLFQDTLIEFFSIVGAIPKFDKQRPLRELNAAIRCNLKYVFFITYYYLYSLREPISVVFATPKTFLEVLSIIFYSRFTSDRTCMNWME